MMQQQSPGLKAKPHEAQFRLKSVDRKLNASGTDSYSVEAYPRYGSSWSQYPKEMFVRGQTKEASQAIFETLGKHQPGDELNLLIVPGKLKAGKADDGDINNYFWNVAGIVDGKPAAVAEEQPVKYQITPPVKSWDDRTVDIEAAWAINQAREMLQYEEHPIPFVIETLVYAAQWFLDAKLMLTNAMRSGVRIGPQNQPSEASAPAEGQPEAATTVAVQPSVPPASVGELLTRATKELGYTDRAAVFEVLGVKSAVELANPEKLAPAWKILVAARKV